MKNNKLLAPIVLFVYNRVDHTKQTIEALKKNRLAEESELFIFSDAPKNEKSMEAVKEVREYIKTINGFKNIVIKKASKNKGLANSVVAGVSEIVNKYEKVIVLEDDLITSPYFLEYMNNALKIYKNQDDIFVISGYSNISVPKEYKNEVYLAHISTSWGWAIWKDRWFSIVWEQNFYREILENKAKIKKYEKLIGNSRTSILKAQLKNKVDSWAIKKLYSQLEQGKMTLFPVKTMVRNIGMDGSGVHCGINKEFDKESELNYKFVKLNKEIKLERRIEKIIYEKNNITFIKKVLRKVKSKLWWK
ncbi:glycosyltransferase [Ilyobacter polytropus]|nr:glycosyltransferase [Ilyobacter polytropus]